MLRCQLLRFDQKLACLSLSHQFPMKVLELQHTPATNAAKRSSSYSLAQHSEMVLLEKYSSVVCRNECYHCIYIIVQYCSNHAVKQCREQCCLKCLRENISWIFRRIAFCCPLGTSMYLWLFSLGLGLVSSHCLPKSLDGKASLLLLGQYGSITPRLHVSGFAAHFCCFCYYLCSQYCMCFVLRGHRAQEMDHCVWSDVDSLIIKMKKWQISPEHFLVFS